ncbi:hypothetical protein SMACR_08773 [Sordaria macrospora]|uniref:Uncharacterized protein n=1 Tax=Sordaria macrospora TaxID=5147 RepID=A0A8S8ZLS8_SORMA|nr:hypothetical protein SMACR_08773 [Sordaria macrospora]KAH7635333.1 hypothetical protein B0T09DRAFT_379143 [Sordaria sp. MPI-SDFR-AT-0083]WPJ67276.1 hypothetical protein SMAC4_08773 [Sordaria macrospora]
MKFSLSVVLAAFALQSTALLVPRDALSSDLGSALAPGAGHILPLESRARKGNSKGNSKGKGKGKHTHAHGVRPDFRKPCKSLPSTCPSFLNKKAMCECKAAATVAAYLESERGCPKPSQKAC